MQHQNPGLMNGKITYLLWVSLLVAAVSVKGQSVDSTQTTTTQQSFYLMPVLNTWLITDNPAGLSQNTQLLPGQLEIGFTHQQGDFKRVQQGNTLNYFKFSTQQYKKIHKTSLYGSFSYDKSYEKGLNYTDINNPYRGTPYLLIDTIKTDNNTADREFFSFSTAFSTPIKPHLNLGMGTDFTVGQSSQNRDPRPRNRVLNISLTPGMLFDLSNIKLGFNLIYGYYNEDIDVDIVRENTHMTFFMLHGLGTSVFHSAASYYRLYTQNNVGIHLQFQYSKGEMNTLFGARWLYYKEHVFDGRGESDASWAHIKNCSELVGLNMHFYNATVFKNAARIHSIKIEFDTKEMLGTEILQRLENDSSQNYMENWVTYATDQKYGADTYITNVSYGFIKLKKAFMPSYSFDGKITYLVNRQNYYIPDRSESYQNLLLSLNYNKTFYFHKNIFSISASFKYNKNLSGTLDIAHHDFIYEKLVYPDFLYLTSNYIVPGIGMSYEIPIKKIKSRLLIQSRFLMYQADNKSTRSFFNISTGINF